LNAPVGQGELEPNRPETRMPRRRRRGPADRAPQPELWARGQLPWAASTPIMEVTSRGSAGVRSTGVAEIRPCGVLHRWV